MLYVHRSERADHLLEVLAGILADPLDDPLAPEVVAVPTRGVERWLTQSLAHRLGGSPGRTDGVAANIQFPFPGSLVGAAVAAASGIDPAGDPWAPERAVWPLLEVVDQHLGDLFLEPLAKHLEASSPGRDDGSLMRFATVRHVADLYDQYGVHRPALIRAWARGEPGEGVADRHLWQADLWRLLRDRIGLESPAERLDAAVACITAEPASVMVPPRVSLFGLTRLPASYLLVLKALAEARDIHLFLLHPSGALWEAVSEESHAFPDGGLRRSEDPTSALPRNPLLRSWGRDAREMQLVLAAQVASSGEHRPVADDPRRHVLHLLQAGIRADMSPAGTECPTLRDDDRSIQIHACHGRYRQVEVLRDAVLHLLSTDETLEPRDVIVMCPDVETFAPLVQAVFAEEPSSDLGGSDSPELRVRLADRSLRQTNPLLAVASALLDLADGRITASQVLDLAGREPVRLRFRFDDDELTVLERWVIEMGTRWGLDSAHRHHWKLGDLATNTWESGLDRLLLGVAMSEEDCRLFEGALPVDDVASTDVDLAGRFAEYVSRIEHAVLALSGLRPITEWVESLARSTEMLACTDPTEGWQSEQLRRVLEEVAAEASTGFDDGPENRKVSHLTQPVLTGPEVRAVLANRLKGRPTRANFRTGDLTVCTLVPMRSVPHRVVCLLGLDDGVFPRHPWRDGDDIVAADPHVGDRDPRSEDRQLLLDAVLAATDHLIITYSGRDERTNRPRPPAVPVAELLDAIDETVRAPDGSARARDALVFQHPLQSFDPRNFTAGTLRPEGPWSFSKVDLEGAKAMVGPHLTSRPFLEKPLPPWDGQVISLESLTGFVKSPVQWFLRERLGIYVNGTRDEPDDRLPIELSSLEEWSFGDRLLRTVLDGATLEDALEVERARGLLPPGPLVDAVLEAVVPSVDQLAQRVQSLPCSSSEARSVEINLRLRCGRTLIGTVAGVRGPTLVNCVYSRLAAKHRLEAWVRFLALSASQPGQVSSAVTIGRSGSRKAGAGTISELRLASDDRPSSGAVDLLEKIVDLYDRGMREPLPLYCKTSSEWASARRGGDGGETLVQKTWEGDRFEGESTEEAHLLVLGGRAPFRSLFETAPRDDEVGPGWERSEPSRFGRLARRLWDDLLDHESMRFFG